MMFEESAPVRDCRLGGSTGGGARRRFRAHVPLAALAAFAALLFGGCGGGGGGSVPAPPATGAPSSGSTAPPKSTARGTVSFSFAIPRAKSTKKSNSRTRRPLFISSGAASLAVTINGGPATTSNLGATQPGCVANGSSEIDCTVVVGAPNGTDAFDVKLYDGANGAGDLLSEGTATASVDGTPQQIPVTMNPYVASIVIGLPQPPTGACGVGQVDTSQPLPITVAAYDASGALIDQSPGTYENPITLTSTDASGSSTLVQPLVTSWLDSPTLNYTGLDYTAPITISATANGVSASQVTPATLNLGTDRPLVSGSVSTYALTTSTLSSATETWSIATASGFPATPFPGAQSIGPAPAVLCQIHIQNPPIANANIDAGDDFLAELYLVAPNEMATDDLYVNAQAAGSGANINLWLSDSTGYENNAPSSALNILPFMTTFSPPTIMGALPHANSLAIQPGFDTFFGQTSILYQQDGTQTTIDQVWELNQSNGANILQEYTAVPSGSQLSPYGNPSGAGSSPTLTVTDAGVGQIPSQCAVGPGIPTLAVHLTYSGGLGNLSSARKTLRLQRGTSAHLNTVVNQPIPTEEWVRRDVGVVCRREQNPSTKALMVEALQAYQP